ncbi:helix-turn-helix domain-containing protein [Micromonospora sp. NPDC003197]
MVNPTIQRRRLGHALKRAREAARKTQDEAAVIIDAAGSKVSRLELGQSGIRLTDLKLLLDFYGVDDEQADAMRDLARAGRQRGRWSGHRSVISDWFRQYVDLEADAAELRWYQAEVLPGILQIEPYIRAMYDMAKPRLTDGEINQMVAVRLDRQAIFDRAEAPELSFILSESAVRRNIGGPAIMRDQLLHLLKVAELPNVNLQVFPFDAQSYETASFNFEVLSFGDDTTSDVVYIEDYTDANYLDRHDDVRTYKRLWDRLQAAALGPVESQRLILSLADEAERRQKE